LKCPHNHKENYIFMEKKYTIMSKLENLSSGKNTEISKNMDDKRAHQAF